VAQDSLLIWWIGQAGFIFKDSFGNILLVDPYLSHSMEGVTYIHSEIPVKPDSIKADCVFCSHDHIDHTDQPTLQGLALAASKIRFYGPPSSVRKVMAFGIDPGRIREIKRGDKINLEGGISVEAVYAEHTPDSVGFVFNFNGISVYHTGDTEIGLERYLGNMKLLERLEPDVMIVCVNPGFNNLGPEDAARLTKFVMPKVVIPMHYDLIEENTIDPQIFLDALVREKVNVAPVVMKYGEKYTYISGTRNRLQT